LVQNVWHPGTGTAAILATTLTLHFLSSTSKRMYVYIVSNWEASGGAANYTEHTNVQQNTVLGHSIVQWCFVNLNPKFSATTHCDIFEQHGSRGIHFFNPTIVCQLTLSCW
jgi:hypothetical protein